MAKKTRWEELMEQYGQGSTGGIVQTSGRAPVTVAQKPRLAPALTPTIAPSSFAKPLTATPTPTMAGTPYSPTGVIPIGETTTTTKKSPWEKLMEQYGEGTTGGKLQQGGKVVPKKTPAQIAADKLANEPKKESFIDKLKNAWAKAGEEVKRVEGQQKTMAQFGGDIKKAWGAAGEKAKAGETEMAKQRAMTPEALKAYKLKKYGVQKAPISLGLKPDEELTLESLSKDKTRGNIKNIALMPLAAVGSIDKYLNSTNKFTARASAKAHNVATADNIPIPSTGNAVKDAAAEMIGYGMGLAMPMGGGAGSSLQNVMNKVAAPVERGLVSTIAKAGLNKGAVGAIAKVGTAATKGYAEFGTLGALEKAREGGNAKEILENAHKAGLQGAALGGILKSVGLASTLPKTISNAKFEAINAKLGELPPLKIKRNLLKGTANTVEIPVAIKAPIAPAYKGTYKIKNVAGEKAVQEYDDAVQTIQNYFKTNKLTPEEVARIKPELGIDVEKLASKLGDKTDVRQIAARNWLARVADVERTAFEPTVTKATEQIPYSRVLRGAKTEQIPSVMTKRTKIPAVTTTVEGLETLPKVSTQKIRIKPEPVKRYLASPLKAEVQTPIAGAGKTRRTLPSGAIASGESKTIVDRASIFRKSGKLDNKLKIEHDLVALKGGETNTREMVNNLEYVTPRARVSGFDLQQRSQVAEELIKGVEQGEKTIKINVWKDGVLEVENNPKQIAQIMDTLKIKNKRSFEPTFETPTTSKFVPKQPTTKQFKVGKTGETFANIETAGTRTQPLSKTTVTPAKTITEPIWSGTEAKALQGRTTRDIKSSGYVKGVEVPTTTVKQYRTEQPLRGGKQKAMPKLAKLKPAEAMKAATPTIEELKTGRVPRNLKLAKDVNGKKVVLTPEGLPLADGLKLGAAETKMTSMGAMARSESATKILSGKEVKLPLRQRAKEFYNKVIREAVDDIRPLKAVDDETYILATNAKKLNSTISTIFDKNLVDMNGKPIGKSLKSVVEKIPRQKENKFFSYIAMKHNVDRALQGKNAFKDFDSKQAQRAVANIEFMNPEFKAVGEDMVNWINTFEKEWGNKSGLISDDLWNSLQAMYKNYIPLNRGFSRIEKATAGLSSSGKGLVDTGNALKKLKIGGSDRAIMNPVMNIMNLVGSTVKTAKHNEIGQSVLKAFRENPKMAKMGKVLPEGAKFDATLDNIVTVLDKGKQVNIEFSDDGLELLQALKGMTNVKEGGIATSVANKANTLFKSLITTSNPIFAVKNVMRDIPVSYIQGSTMNPIKHAAGIIDAYRQLAKNTPLANQYRAIGGEMANLVSKRKYAQGADELMARQLLSNAKGELMGSKNLSTFKQTAKKVLGSIEKFNNLTESAPRFAEFKRVFEKTGDVQKALYEAGEVTVNFARGGTTVKAIDKVAVPYLNASIQGLDKFARGFGGWKKSGKTLIKGGLAVAAPQAFFHFVNQDNPNYKALDNRTKDNYFLIPTGETFIKIPKSREYGFIFGTLFDRGLRAMNGDATTKGLKESFTKAFLPNDPVMNNIFMPWLKLKIGGNDVKDWAGRTIIPQGLTADQRSAFLQFDEKSTELSKWLANQLQNLPEGKTMLQSPKKIDFLINSYLGVLSQVGVPQALTATKAGAKTRPERLLKSVTGQFTADPIYSNQATTDFYDNKNKIINQTSNEKEIMKIPKEQQTYLKAAKKYYDDSSKAMAERYDAIQIADAANNVEEVKRLRKEIIQIAAQANAAFQPAPKINYKELRAPK